jgi:hypothetical protein
MESESMSAEPTAPAPNWELAGECLAAVTGLFPEGSITVEQGREAEKLIGYIAECAEKFCKFGKFEKFQAPKKVNFEEAWAKLMPLTEEEIGAATADLTEPDLIDAWSAAVNRGREAARSTWPVIIRQTPTGPEWVEPSRTSGNRAAVTLAVLDRPMSLFDELKRGVLTPSMVEVVSLAYPELFGRAKEIFAAVLPTIEKSCPWSHESQLRILFNLPPKLTTFGVNNDPEPKRSGEFQINFDDTKTKTQLVR